MVALLLMTIFLMFGIFQPTILVILGTRSNNEAKKDKIRKL